MSLLTDLKELLLPRTCPVCGKLLVAGEDVLCAFCAVGLPRYHIQDTSNNPLLQLVWDLAEVQKAMTFLSYKQESPYHKLIIDFKFHGRSDLAVKLGRWAALEAKKHDFWEGVDALVPVPLTWRRRWQRGYNQAEMLAKGMAIETGLPVVKLLKRTKNSTPQSRLQGEVRRKNAEGIYLAKIPDKWQGKGLVLVDDVMTTGATLGNCALALLKADNSAKISLFPLAHAE